MIAPPGLSRGHGLWAVTAYFNPLGYRRRRDNYRIFRERLRVPLVAVELGFDGRYDLCDGDAEVLIRIGDGDVMFQKERLLNLAVSHVPAECDHIAWLDCDIVFESDGWMEAAAAALKRHAFVQLFGRVDYMPAGWSGSPSGRSDVYFSRPSIGSAIANGREPRAAIHMRIANGEIPVCARGFAWAACRSVLERVGLYDECIVGGGDSALVSAVYDDLDRVVRRQEMSPAQEARYSSWARMLRSAGGDSVSFVAGRIFHLWHGAIENRGHGVRHAGFRRFEFDPAVDIVRSISGAWRWGSAKPEMHDFVANYFVSRSEDA